MPLFCNILYIPCALPRNSIIIHGQCIHRISQGIEDARYAHLFPPKVYFSPWLQKCFAKICDHDEVANRIKITIRKSWYTPCKNPYFCHIWPSIKLRFSRPETPFLCKLSDSKQYLRLCCSDGRQGMNYTISFRYYLPLSSEYFLSVFALLRAAAITEDKKFFGLKRMPLDQTALLL